MSFILLIGSIVEEKYRACKANTRIGAEMKNIMPSLFQYSGVCLSAGPLLFSVITDTLKLYIFLYNCSITLSFSCIVYFPVYVANAI